MKSLALLCLFFVLSVGTPSSSARTIRYHRSGVQDAGWKQLERSEETAPVAFTLALKQRNLDILEAKLYADADPLSPHYAQHMSREEVRELVSPPRAIQHQIIQWVLETAQEVGVGNLFDLKNHGDAIHVFCTVKLAERLFDTELHNFENVKTGRVLPKHLGALSIPDIHSQHIQLVSGITELPPSKSPFLEKNFFQNKKRADDSQCNVPYTIKQLYHVPQNLTVTNPHANQSIYCEDSVDTPEGFGFGSLAYWEKANGLPKNPINCILGNGNNSIISNDTDDEAQLDTQMMTGMAVGAPTCFYIMAQGFGWMYEFALTIFNTPEAPLVVSMSYGWYEFQECVNMSDPEDTWFLGNCTYLNIPNDIEYVARTNVEFMKLGLVGHTLVASSGDDGVAGGHDSPNNCQKQAPIFPAASPFVLTVGGTSVENSKNDDLYLRAGAPPVCTKSSYQCVCSTSTNEQPASQNNNAGFDSGGGFSWYTPRPSYQDAAVTAYLNSGVKLPDSSLFNSSNRGFPDIAGVSENVCTLDPGSSCELSGGTSASAPLLGSLITLLNNDRLNAGKTPLGFINPLIYQMFAMNGTSFFNNGFAKGSNGGECGDDFGFHAKAGYWTPITGVGSPKFDAIRAYVATLP